MRYNLSRQEEKYWCFPACLQAVLRRYDIHEEQRDIALALGTDENGTLTKGVKKFLRLRGFNFEHYDYNATPFNEPDFLLNESTMRGLDVVVAVPGTRIKHVLLVQRFQKDELTLLDPEGGIKTRNLNDLYREMFQRKMGGFGIILRH